MKLQYLILLLCFVACNTQNKEESVRREISLNKGWKTAQNDSLPNTEAPQKIEVDSVWKSVDVPHNWDQYYGYRREEHGNLHGTAWYQRELEVSSEDSKKQHFLFFEGVGSYATVWVNGKKVGQHKGGRTTFTLNISEVINFDESNTILVKADHPAYIADLPWVCGGCSGEWGFSEGSQPLGIFRPVSLVVTNETRIEPFGVHIWSDNEISEERAILNITTELKNYGSGDKNYTVKQEFFDADKNEVVAVEDEINLNAGESREIEQVLPEIKNPKLWSPGNSYLYELSTTISENGEVVDRLKTPYGIRWVSWPINREGEDNRLYINDEPHFINGTCEYEHLIGGSHAFTDTQVKARVDQMIAGGFNSFRESHQPHNLRYQKHLDEAGITFWSQFSAHIWYDTPEFKENFKKLLRNWIKERRNSPSIIMWGLQNESTIPKEFAEECTRIIREMDPTSAVERLVTTCNGGVGTDWNVIQNWSGTYGGDPYNYGNELTEQLLNGEYGAWRTLDLHTEGPFDQDGEYSENRFSQLMEIKVREAESVRDKVVGQYNWLFNSHENPGRIQNGEGYRDIDKVGPVNYKGLVTPWAEPVDAYYMYRANYISKEDSPMVYIVSHTWPNRWEKPGVKDSITVYSNTDEVELFNDINGESLGKKENPGRGKHFEWYDVDINYNVLYAVGYVDGEAVAKDYIVLDNLPESPNFEEFYKDDEEVLKGEEDLNYLYRVNSGGPAFKDSFDQEWAADVQKVKENTWGSLSWTDDFENLPAFFASQRRVFDPIAGTKNWDLFQTFRYGTDRLKYEFPVPDGEYQVELYFVEPWYGTGGGFDAINWRNFDVAVNDSVHIDNLDIWKEVGHDTALKKTLNVESKDGKIVISFPQITSGQAVISGIAIATADESIEPAPASSGNINSLEVNNVSADLVAKASWLDISQQQYLDSEVSFTELPYQIYGAEWLKFSEELSARDFSVSFTSKDDAWLYAMIDSDVNNLPAWLSGFEEIEETAANNRGDTFKVLRKEVNASDEITLGKNSKQLSGNYAMYSLALVPKYEMGETEEEEARPNYEFLAPEGDFSGSGITNGNFKDSDYIEFTENTENKLEFEVNPGLAGVYLMRYRYMNLSGHPIEVELQIEDANGILVHEGEIEFPPAEEKFRILNTTSGGYINAGTYKIRITSEEMKGLRINRFEFQ